MPLYYFILKTERETIPDCEGIEFPDETAARLHATTVAQQLMRNRELKTRGWRIQVCDDYLRPTWVLFFADVDSTLQRFPPHLTSSVARVVRTMAAFNDTLLTMQDTLKDVRATLAHADRLLASLPPGTAGERRL